MQRVWNSQNKTTNLQEYPFITTILLLSQKTKIWHLTICAIAKWCTTHWKPVYMLHLISRLIHGYLHHTQITFSLLCIWNIESSKPLEIAKCNFLIIRHLFCQSIARAPCQESWKQNWFIQKKKITRDWGWWEGISSDFSVSESLAVGYLFVFHWFSPLHMNELRVAIMRAGKKIVYKYFQHSGFQNGFISTWRYHGKMVPLLKS